MFVQGRYTCDLSNLTIAESEFDEITVAGNHLVGRDNHDVEVVELVYSEVPFIITRLFQTFPNLRIFATGRSGFREIRRNDFINVGSLNWIVIQNNPLENVPAAAFIGARQLRVLDLSDNLITQLDEDAFFGLNELFSVALLGNQIETLPLNLFRPLIRLEVVFLSRNKLTRLDSMTFQNNQLIRQLDFRDNQINAVARSFFDFIRKLLLIDMIGNRCVNQTFVEATSTEIREGFSDCFDNYANKN
jgi:Leucine-rich repeat (LRR) protein